MAEQDKQDAVGFVTKKVLVTFVHRIAIMYAGTAIFAEALICEYQENTKSSENWRSSFGSIPTEFTVVGLPDGRKLEKSIQLKVGLAYGVSGMVEID